jgi:hypothetical protein
MPRTRSDVHDNERRRILIGMANAWLRLAEQHLKNRETALVCETPTLPLKASDDLKELFSQSRNELALNALAIRQFNDSPGRRETASRHC